MKITAICLNIALACTLACAPVSKARAEGKTINQLQPAAPLTGSELFPILQGANPAVKASLSAISAFVAAVPFLVGSGGPSPYTFLNINGADADPSLTHNGSASFSLNGAITANALVCGIALTSQLPWCQSRNWFSDFAVGMLLNPLGGGVAINSRSALLGTNLTGGVQIGADWATTDTYIPAGSAGATFQVSQLAVFNNDTAAAAPVGISIAARDGGASSPASTIGLSSLCFAEHASPSGSCWSLYTEGHKLAADDVVFAMGEFAAVNRVSGFVGDSTPFSGPGPFDVLNAVLDCGNGIGTSVYVEYSCSSAILIQANLDATQGATNSKGFLHGIVFLKNAFDTTNGLNPPDAIALAGNTFKQAISWWADGSTRAWLIYSDAASGANSLQLHTTTAQFTSHVIGGGGTPTNSACTGFSLATGSTDSNGTVSFTSATSCAIAFAGTYANAPFCNVTPGSAVSTVKSSATTTVLTATFGTAQTSMTWQCPGA